MAANETLSATVRAKGGKGAARAERRQGRVPGVIYGDKKPPVLISLDYKTLHLKHRVIPRDYQLDPVKDTPVHVDFLRLGAGAEISVEIPVHVKGAETSPGVKLGGTVNLVLHSLTLLCNADSIPDGVDVDISQLAIGSSVHMNDVKLPAGTRPASKENVTILSIVAPTVAEVEPAAEAAPAAAPAAKK